MRHRVRPRARGRLLLPALILLWPAISLARQEPAPRQVPPGAEVHIQARPPQATVGDPIEIELEVTLPEGWQLNVPRLQGPMGDFVVLESFPGPDLPPSASAPKTETPPTPAAPAQGAALRRHRIRIVAALYKTGEFEFPSLPLELRDAQGNTVPLPAPTIKVRILSVLEGSDAQLLDLKKQAEIEEPVRWLLWLSLAGLALAFLAALWWCFARRAERPRLTPSLPPDLDPLDLAEASLRDLVSRDLLQKGLVKQFYVSLADILKTALEAAFRTPTLEKTTSEIIAALAAVPRAAGNPADLFQIEKLLLSCDLVKFARYLPAPVESEQAVQAAFRVLEECRAKRQPAVPAEEPVAGATT